jgi:hypothetical protein
MAAHASTTSGSTNSGGSGSSSGTSSAHFSFSFSGGSMASRHDARRLDWGAAAEPVSMDCSASGGQEGGADTSLRGRYISQACTLRLALCGPSSTLSPLACPAGERVMLVDRGALRRQAARRPPALAGGPLDAPATLQALDGHGRAHSILRPLPVALPCHQ